MSVQFKNNSFTTLAVSIDADDTTVVVAEGTGASLPTIGVGEYFYATLTNTAGDMEIIKVTARTDDTLTVERGAEGTTGVPFVAGSLLENRFTAQTLRDIADLDYLLL